MAAPASSAEVWAIRYIRSFFTTPAFRVAAVAAGSVGSSMATPIRSLPSPPVLETLVTWLDSLPIRAAFVALSGVFASATICTLRLATAVSAPSQSGVVASTWTPQIVVGGGVCRKAMAIAAARSVLAGSVGRAPKVSATAVAVAVAAALSVIVVALVTALIVVPFGMPVPVTGRPTSAATKAAVAEVTVVVLFSTASVTVRTIGYVAMAVDGSVNSCGAESGVPARPFPTIAMSPYALVAGTNRSLLAVTSMYLTGIGYLLLPYCG